MLTCRTGDPAAAALLKRHPHVTSVLAGAGSGIAFTDGTWDREARCGDPGAALYGLVELMDNNPLVCADVASTPGCAGTLALIALGPVALASLLSERPVLVLNVPTESVDIDMALRSAQWADGAEVHYEPMDLGSVMVASAIAVIPTPENAAELQDLYEERFGRSFFVRAASESEWDPERVRGTPFAFYRLSLAFDQDQSLLTVRVMADREGKCGAAQVVHLMNVMCGFEETLGIL